MSAQRRSVASRLYAGLGRVTWGFLRRKVNERFNRRAGGHESGSPGELPEVSQAMATPDARSDSTASAVVVGDTPAVRSSSTLVLNPAATASAAVALTQ